MLDCEPGRPLLGAPHVFPAAARCAACFPRRCSDGPSQTAYQRGKEVSRRSPAGKRGEPAVTSGETRLSSALSTAGGVVHRGWTSLVPARAKRSAGQVRPIPTATVFSRADARACGWSDAALTRAVRSGRVLRLKHDQFTAPANRDDPRVAAAAAARSCRYSVVSHRSAALIHNLPLLHPPPARPDLTITPRATGDVSGALLHRATLQPEDVIEVDGVAVTTVARTLIDIGRSTSTAAAVVTIDAALHRRLADAQDLEEIIRACRHWPRIRRARLAVALADPRAESPLESFSRLVLRWLKLPPPDLQPSVYDETGAFVGRADFYWDQFGVVGEADGRDKYDKRDVLTAEKVRQEHLANCGIEVARWGWADARYRPRHVAERIRRAFERGRCRDHSGFPRQWSVSRA
jgi:Transcriptional regulator, AbiEi antitoxin